MDRANQQGGRYLRCDLNSKPQAIGSLRFCIDPPNGGRSIRDSIFFQGWVVHRQQGIAEVVCRSADGARRVAVRPGGFRPGVAERFGDYHNAGAAGFELVLDDPLPGDYQFLVHLEDGREIHLDTAHVTEHARPKLLFMHIAKTAGTSVNSCFARNYPNELAATHVESDVHWNRDPEYARRFEFLSGHIRFAQFEQTLDLSDYYLVTLLREPYAHLRSHLAWIKRLSEPSEAARRDKHPLYVQALSASLWNLDLTDAGALDRFVQSLQGEALQLLDNCQTRYFSGTLPGERVVEHDCRVAERALNRFDKVGITESLGDFIDAVAQELHFESAPATARQNVAGTYYGLDVNQDEIRKVIEPLVHFDLRLYRRVKGQWIVGSRPNRPSGRHGS